jgi:hypothetical protein
METSVVQINRGGIFGLHQANEVLPVIRKITEDYKKVVEQKMGLLEALPNHQQEAIQELEDSVNALIQEWHVKVKKLGGIPKGLWLVDFDNGKGYFCWKYPESKIEYWHKYTDGFTGRIHISELELEVVGSRTPLDEKPATREHESFL